MSSLELINHEFSYRNKSMSTEKDTNSELFSEIMSRAMEASGSKNQKELAERLGLSTGDLSSRKKRGRLPFDRLVELARSHNASLDWIIFGEPAPGILEVKEGYVADPDYAEIPLYDIEASAGHGSLFDHERIGSYLKFRNDWLTREGLHQKDLVAIRVSGDSMDGTLADGDAVLIDRSRKKPDGVFAIRIGDALRIKRLQRLTDGSLRVSSDNEMYREEIIHPENMDQVEIVGQCYWRAGRVF